MNPPQRLHGARPGAGALACLLVLAGASMSYGALPAGRVVEFRAESPHPVPRSRGSEPAFQVSIHHPGATYVAVHFGRFDLGPEARVVVRSESGRQSYVFTGRGKGNLGAFWATHIKGERATVELFSRGRRSAGWGVSIDRDAAGFVDLGGEGAPAPESVCAPDDRRNAACYRGSDPDAYDHARPVARLLIEGTLLCSGFLVGCEGHLLTNNHCIDDPELSDPATATINTDYEFMAEAPDCGSPNGQLFWPGVIWGGAASLVKTDQALDYAFILLQGAPHSTYGSLVLDDRGALLGERIYLPQHGGGLAKELGIESSDLTDQGGVCRVFRNNEASCSGGPGDVGYFCDTDGGSSGAPVIAYTSHKVIAMHHCGGCPALRNTATAIFRVIDDLGGLLPASALGAGAFCGDATLQCGELCDGAQLDGETCTTQGFTAGLLACRPDCNGFDTSSCLSICGDAMVGPDEACDGPNLNGESCVSLGFDGGVLACDGLCKVYDTSGCTSLCGNDMVSPVEVCDGMDLDGESCATQGFDSGTISCNGNCTAFDTVACCGPIDLDVDCQVADSGSPSSCDGSDQMVLGFDKPSPGGIGVDVYLADESDLFLGSTGPVSCLGNDLEGGSAPGSPIALTVPFLSLAVGEVGYYLVACHQCGGLIASGFSRSAGVNSERIIGPACAACP